MGQSEFQTPAMESGDNEYSYSRNSKIQSRAIELHLQPVLQEEISQLRFNEGEGGLRLINVADLGCAMGDNTLRYAELVLESLQNRSSPDIHYFFSDLPTNDFNTLFHQLESWKKTRLVIDEGKFYPAAVPGSFFERLFPPGSLHIVISTWALQYLSKVPDAVTDKASAAYNKHRVWIHKSPPAVVDAYAQLSKQNLLQFFSCRAQEVASGGLVVLYFPARVDEQHPENQFEPHLEEKSPLGTIFEEAWKTLVMEGTISEERWDSFNMPFFVASMGEVRAAVTATGAFHIKQMQVEELHYLEESEEKQLVTDPEAYGRFYTRFVEGVLRPYIENHIGKESGEKLFQRLTQLAATATAQQKNPTRLAVACMLVVLIRK